MSMFIRVAFLALGLLGSLGGKEAVADSGLTGIRIVGRGEVVVTEPVVRLSDVAQIESARVQDDEAVVQLRKIVIAQSPKAGQSAALQGMDILSRLRDEGVKLDSIRYTLPREVSVTRAFREITADELERALLSFVSRSDKQLEVKKLVIDNPVRVPPDASGVEVVGLRATNPGHIGVDYRALSESDDTRFQLKALVDEWRLVPVATRPVARGSVVSAQDIELTRMNASIAGRDAVDNVSDVVGRVASKQIGQGEVFRASALSIPPVVSAGSRVTLVFRQGRLEATATGTALESGQLGQEIRVRNDSSKKIIPGKILEPGLVSVGG
jgi:flagella basal body P-ring formation protein FlgA